MTCLTTSVKENIVLRLQGYLSCLFSLGVANLNPLTLLPKVPF